MVINEGAHGLCMAWRNNFSLLRGCHRRAVELDTDAGAVNRRPNEDDDEKDDCGTIVGVGART